VKITKSQLKQIIKEELESVLEIYDLGGEDPPTPGDVKFSGQYDQAFDEEPDVLSKAAAGDIDMLQAFEEMIELNGGSKDELHDTLARLLGMVEEDPEITSEPPEFVGSKLKFR
tara:strand:+ start:117 stop:458 length:342 start_codon:yes stop_codon:yes gene_type:complete